MAAGVAAGLGLGVAGARAARAVLFGVGPLDPLSVAVAAALMAATAALAMVLSARRLRGLDPAEAMRTE